MGRGGAVSRGKKVETKPSGWKQANSKTVSGGNNEVGIHAPHPGGRSTEIYLDHCQQYYST